MSFGKFISNAVKAAGKVVKPITKPVGKALRPITRPIEKGIINPVGKAIVKPVFKEIDKAIATVQKVPVLGQVFNIYTGKHVFGAFNAVLEGQRIDRAALNGLKGQVREYKLLAPYAASIVAFVPGVGPGVGAGVAAGLALAEGQPLSQVAIAAIKGSIPGGAIAQAAFNATQAAVAGKKLDDVAIAALPLDARTKQALKTAIGLTKDLASGKRLDKALVARADDALKLLTPELRKAVNIGTAVGVGQIAQKQLGKVLSNPATKKAIADIGVVIAKTDKVIAAGRMINKDPGFRAGFDTATGLLKGKNVTPIAMISLRTGLTPIQKKGFDAAAALQIGRVRNMGRTVGKTPAQAAAFLTTVGIAGADVNQKVGIIKELAVTPELREGAVNAIRQIASERDKRTLWQIIKSVFGFK